ncbi:MAG TPA: sulfotransferase domain-containing protein [Thermohalobaculum sp.]|nr:sulfotransferase domain-containing protein [Thermohalobaculum sp.]
MAKAPTATAPTGGATPGKNIVWLASYPKSGNTWLRIFLANYLLNRTTPMPINQVHRIGMGDAIEKAYRLVARGPFNERDPHQVLALRPGVLARIVANGAQVNFVKTHNVRGKAFGIELIPPPLTRSAIYILRNPLDMVLSYARHYGQTPEFAAAAIGRPDNAVAGGFGAVTQFLGNWSEHVRGWTRCRDFPVLVLRYEDLQADPQAGFARTLAHIGVPLDAERLERAVRFSSFEEVSRQEAEGGFVERSAHGGRFFHAGRTGQWRESLPAQAAERIRREHARVMREFGYLDEE